MSSAADVTMHFIDKRGNAVFYFFDAKQNDFVRTAKFSVMNKFSYLTAC